MIQVSLYEEDWRVSNCLEQVVYFGLPSFVRRLTEQGNAGLRDHCTGDLLRKAAALGHTELARWLLQNGADPNHEILRKSSAGSHLEAAARHGHVEIVELLIDGEPTHGIHGTANHRTIWYSNCCWTICRC
jgi:hypothetical protein